MPDTYYNEHDPHAAEWLRNLMARGELSEGTVDETDIQQIVADRLMGVRRAHFFAGIGGWDLALQLAGWPEDWSVWTGSCPCQPFSVAGKGLGEADERHLWPTWRELIRKCLPDVIFGEQVASKAGREWFAGVRADLEEMGYAVGGGDLCAASVGTPHIRQRLYWVAFSRQQSTRRSVPEPGAGAAASRCRPPDQPRGSSRDGGMAIAQDADGRTEQPERTPRSRRTGPARSAASCARMGNASSGGLRTDGSASRSDRHADKSSADGRRMGSPILPGLQGHAGNVNDGNEPRRIGEEPNRSAAETGRASRMDISESDGREGGTRLHGKHDRPQSDCGREPYASGVAIPACDRSATGIPEPTQRKERNTGEPLDSSDSRSARNAGGMADTEHDDRRPNVSWGRSQGRETDVWSRSTLIPCADGKSRRTFTRLAIVADGFSDTMAPGSATSFGTNKTEETPEAIDAASENTRPDQALRVLPVHYDAEIQHERGSGGSDLLHASPILLATMHGGLAGRKDQNPECCEQQAAGPEESKVGVPGLLDDQQSSRAPHRRESDEQRRPELDDVVRLLPSALACAVYEGDSATAQALLALFPAGKESGLVQHPLFSKAEAWRSPSREEIKSAFEQGRFDAFRVITGRPLAKGPTPSRTVQLRGYGNAIIPQLAAEFIRAAMEAREELFS